MKKTSILFLALINASVLIAGGDVHYSHNRLVEKTYLDNKRVPDETYQAELREQYSWKKFLQDHGTWYVWFNEENQKPHRAYGSPIQVTANDPANAAISFINQHLGLFNIPVNELELKGVYSTDKYHNVNFIQKKNGVEVFSSRFTVKMTHDFRVIMWGADVYTDIPISTTAAITPQQAVTYASQDITNETITGSTFNFNAKILPVPYHKNNNYKLVYEVNVKTIDDDNIPADYYTLVDANTGEVYYRSNKVKHIEGDKKKMPGTIAEVESKADVHLTHQYNPQTNELLPNLEFQIGPTIFNTDINGFLNTGLNGPQTATFRLEGLWSDVATGGVTPSFSTTLNGGLNNISFNTNANVKERSAYYHVNVVHDHCKALIPSFTGMDFSLPTNIDVTGTCNAFYNGTSINFLSPGGGCTSFATVADVVYHEYGHGINDNFYNAGGQSFINGAMNEGYADVWAFSITESAVLGFGTDDINVNEFIRRYDENRKVYPTHIVGEVHADGEIIAGAWWDTYLNLGSNMTQTMQLFVEAFPGYQATNPDGDEGQAFTEVLLDVLLADDTDADITNGTPNGLAIVDAFALHGITLISNATLAHSANGAALSNTGININANLSLTFPWTNYLNGVNCYYRVNNSMTWNTVPMTAVGMNYSCVIPAQTAGTIVAYYLGASDINGQMSAVKPFAAHIAKPNIPYFILVGYDLELSHDLDVNSDLGNFQNGVAGDNNTTGTWEEATPIGSFATVGDTSTCVEPFYQHTPGGDICFVTGLAPAPSSALGTNDVDGGKTTLMSPNINLTTYDNPAVSYYRWYINNPATGANPNADWWHVQVSDNGGSSWTFVENTKVSDKSWRRFAFRVDDYVNITSQFRIRFVVSDSTHLGQNLDGGSLIEAGVDDIEIWSEETNSIDEISGINSLALYPNPASDQVTVEFNLENAGSIRIELMDVSGRLVQTMPVNASSGEQRVKIDVAALASGMYQLRMVTTTGSATRSISVE